MAAGKRNEQETFTFRLGRGGWKSADDSNSLASHATVRPVLGGDHGNLSLKNGKALGSYPTRSAIQLMNGLLLDWVSGVLGTG